jgi:glycosyltransferase involved in cell wall biosynthesis
VRDELRRQGFRRVRWWKRGIDTELFQPGPRDEAVRTRLTDGHPEEFLIINVGRQSPEKGLKEIRDHLFAEPGVRMAFVGGGPSHEQLRAHYRGTPTVFPGFLRGADLVAAYRAADAFIFPSTTETFGLVALEAMACRLPVIAAKAGGVVDTVVDGENGFFYEPARLEQITGLISRLRTNPQLREQMADNGVKHAQGRSWRATMDQLIDYYRIAGRVFRRGRQPLATTVS